MIFAVYLDLCIYLELRLIDLIFAAFLEKVFHVVLEIVLVGCDVELMACLEKMGQMVFDVFLPGFRWH